MIEDYIKRIIPTPPPKNLDIETAPDSILIKKDILQVESSLGKEWTIASDPEDSRNIPAGHYYLNSTGDSGYVYSMGSFDVELNLGEISNLINKNIIRIVNLKSTDLMK